MSTKQIIELQRLSTKKELNKYELAMKNHLMKKWQLEELDKEFKIIYE